MTIRIYTLLLSETVFYSSHVYLIDTRKENEPQFQTVKKSIIFDSDGHKEKGTGVPVSFLWTGFHLKKRTTAMKFNQ